MILFENTLELILTIEGGAIFSFFLAVFITSLFEKEDRAAYLSLICGIVLAVPFLLPFLINISYPYFLLVCLVVLPPLVLFVLFLPFRGKINYIMQNPVDRFDERDTMFSRRTLEPGTERFERYYARRPGNRSPDDRWRALPGLLKSGSKYYDPVLFAAAGSMFDRVVEDLHPRVEGEVAEAVAANSEEVSGRSPEEISEMLVRMAIKWGAISAGVTELRDYHVYSIGGRGERYDLKFELEHKYALALTVEMDYDMMRTAPAAPTVLESANQYLQSGMIAVQLAEFIRSLGFPARAHIDGNYKVICPLVARDAGLGEIGRMGLLMTPKLGPRCRIAVITTDLPLIPAGENQMSPRRLRKRRNLAATTIDFCRRCEKCAAVCPSQSIPFGPEPDYVSSSPGAGGSGPLKLKRWIMDDASCFEYWCKAGTDCGRCMIVCPYSHPDNWFHRFIRFGIRNNVLFRRLALPLDDAFYGNRPRPRQSV